MELAAAGNRTPDSQRWNLAADAAWIARAARTVTEGKGILVHGEPGAGQEELAIQIVKRLRARQRVIEIVRTSDVEAHQQLEHLVAAPPAQGHVLYVPDITGFEGPVMDLAFRLVRRHAAVVIAVSPGVHAESEATLARHLGLERFRVPELGVGDAREYLERGLRGPLSQRARDALWSTAAGNRARLRMMAEDWDELDYLVHIDGIWVLRNGDQPVGPRLGAYLEDLLVGVDSQARKILEVLALATELPLAMLLELGGPEAVDTVHGLGLLELRETAGREVRLRGPIFSRGIARQVPPGRTRLLFDEVVQHFEQANLPEPAGLAPWRRRCGLPVEAAAYYETARNLLYSGAPERAAKLLRLVGPEEGQASIETARMELLLAVGPSVHPGKIAAWQSTERQDVAPGASETGPERSSTVSAIEALEMAWSGDFTTLLRVAGEQSDMSPEVGWLWQQNVHEATLLKGNVQHGLRAGRELLKLMEQSEVDAFVTQRCRVKLFELEGVAGEWARATATLAGDWEVRTWAHGTGKYGSLYDGLAAVMDCRFADAIEQLEVEIPQLEIMGRHDLAPLAHSLHAIALAKLMRPGDARAALANADSASIESPALSWRMRWSTGFFWAHAMGLVGRADEGVRQLVALASGDRERGNVSQELMSLSAAMEWGYAPAVDLMAEAAEHADGRFAEACVWVVRGLRSAEPRELEYGALQLRALGQHFFADYVQRQLEEVNGPCPLEAEKAAKGVPAQEISSSGRDIAAAYGTLTSRQRSVVRGVLADQGNGEIARSLGVSVRTVESHLYQAYGKLQVTGRGELRELLTGNVLAFAQDGIHT